MIGNLLNMAALRFKLSGELTFIEALRKSRETALNAFSNSDLPFETTVENLKFERDPGRNPIFQVILQVMPAKELKLGDLQVRLFHFDPKSAQFDLSLHLYEVAGGYSARFEYCTDLFQADTIERLSLNFIHLLEGIVRDPEQRISEISILAEAERHRILGSNSTSRHYAKEKCVHHLFEEAAGKGGARAAAECDGRSLTSSELNGRANRLANYLVKSGVEPGSFVGVHLDRSLDLIVALLGVLKAGAAYVPLDPSFPPDRLACMMEDGHVSTVVTCASLSAQLRHSGRSAICLDTERERIQREDAANPNIRLSAKNLAYSIYTSGSTGKPKGVMIEHRSVVNLLLSMQKEPGFTEHDVLLAVTTVSFDIAALELFLPLITGAKVVMARKDEVVDGRLLLKLIERSGVTTLQATPGTWKLLIDAGWRSTPRLRMLCGGESLPRDLANKMLDRGGELWNMYGPTETTVWSSVQKIAPGNGPVFIGPPIANTQFYIVDAKMRLVPIGVPGELLIGGDGLSRGYLNRPELTAERFTENPFFNSGGRVYRTGDLARFRENGTIEFLGRLDSQVKVRGFRIELGEIEHCLVQHEGVHDAVVVTSDEGNGDKRLVACFIPAAGAVVTVNGLREFLRAKLPAYMIPSFFVEMQTFPLTPNGKIDRKKLPEPGISRLESSLGYATPQGELEIQLAGRPCANYRNSCAARETEHVPPRDDLEAKLTGIWEQVLGVHPIGVKDNFFDLGGHSLALVRLFARIEKELKTRTFGRQQLLPAVIFRAPTVEELAQVLRQEEGDRSLPSLVPIQPHGSSTPFFWIHGDWSNAFLSDYLGPDQPLFGLEHQSQDGKAAEYTRVETIAEHYLRQIRHVQAQGPYLLGGFSFGGVVAFEIAQRLKAQGQTVSLLVMLDSPFPGATVHASGPMSAAKPRRLLRHFQEGSSLTYLTLLASDPSIKPDTSVSGSRAT